ncbi:hypothetical protein CU254_00190 [Amycolatopsis sp. AA4]|uniref:hypothetical protein n=1 Tax=Actinomycetes TaxID=1760 RepID=UPI0001B554C4|nr:MULTISPECIES: hypothetical protein [Actinomycetes]ATY09082.1 hypothetical protein CU254_00190 [Amycolatopsis sp. AA4]
MSSYSSAGARRSRTLTVGGGLGLLGALSGLLWGAMVLVQGEGLLRPAVQEYLQTEARDLASSGLLTADDLTKIAMASFTARAAIWLVIGLVTLVSAAMVLAAHNWARVVLTVFAVFGIGLGLRDLIDVNPALLNAFDTIAVLSLLAVLVVQWLPGANRAVRARKNAVLSRKAAAFAV